MTLPQHSEPERIIDRCRQHLRIRQRAAHTHQIVPPPQKVRAPHSIRTEGSDHIRQDPSPMRTRMPLSRLTGCDGATPAFKLGLLRAEAVDRVATPKALPRPATPQRSAPAISRCSPARRACRARGPARRATRSCRSLGGRSPPAEPLGVSVCEHGPAHPGKHLNRAESPSANFRRNTPWRTTATAVTSGARPVIAAVHHRVLCRDFSSIVGSLFLEGPRRRRGRVGRGVLAETGP